MKRILCYGDSNTYGHNPSDGTRLPRHQRWPGILASLLGSEYEIIEEGLCGRTASNIYPESPWISGLTYLKPCLLSHRPLDLVIIMLGTNDIQIPFRPLPLTIARGINALAGQFFSVQWEPEKEPALLLVSPILIGNVSVHPKFGPLFGYENGCELSKQLAPYYQEVARYWGCEFFDAASAASPSVVDGLHMEPCEHDKLARALAQKIKEMDF